MPSSNPIDMNEVRSNGAGLYVSLKYVSEKVDSGSAAVDKFYWVRSNANGGTIDERDNKIVVGGASWWTEKATALANIPEGYDDTIIEGSFKTDKYMAYMDLFPVSGRDDAEKNASVQRVKDSLDVFVAAGGNACVIPLMWGEVFKNTTEQDANSSTSWARYDDLITYAKNKGIKVSLRICVDLDDGILNVGGTGTAFYGLDNQSKDEWGYPSRISYGSGHVSLSCTTGVEMLLNFLQKALTRYSTLLGSQFLWYSVVTTAQQESGENYENQHYTVDGNLTSLYKTSFDHSSHARTAFQSWCQTKYTTIEALRDSWGSSDASFSVIETPKSGVAFGTTDPAPFLNIFKTNKGKDFWQFTYQTIRAFQITCEALAPSGIKYTLEYGSCSDIMAALRYSCFISDAGNYSQQLKAQFGAVEGYRDVSFSLDVIRSNYTGKIGVEINHFDAYGQYGATTVAQMKNICWQLAKSAIDSQAKEIVWISDYNKVNDFNAIIEVMQQAKAYQATFNSETPVVATINYKLGEILNDYNSVLNRWKSANGDTNSRVNIIQSSTIDYVGGGTGDLPTTTFSIYPISQYFIKDNTIKSNGRFTVVNNHLEYNIDNTFTLLVPTHSIDSAGNPATSKSTIKIIGSDGFEYIRSVQNESVRNTEISNNHPDREYIREIGDDARFVLPTLSFFDIVCENTGASTITFEVFSADPPDSGAISYSVSVSAGNTSTYRLSSASLAGLPWYKRQIKVNNNRYT